MAEKISVLLVDDHSLVRMGFRRLLEDEADISVAGEAANGEDAVKLARSLQPQVIVMDCALPGMSGLQATRKILESSPNTLILMLSMHTERRWCGGRSTPVREDTFLKTPTTLNWGLPCGK